MAGNGDVRILGFLDNLPSISWNKHKEEKAASFNRGYRAGVEEGFEIANEKKRYDCRNLTEQEKEEVMQYLINNNLEFGYNVENGGFYVLKRR
jgi:hypothetical protein